ncbi:MAG: matrixin family metalloprotease [Acidimicrobiales bacterium]
MRWKNRGYARRGATISARIALGALVVGGGVAVSSNVGKTATQVLVHAQNVGKLAPSTTDAASVGSPVVSIATDAGGQGYWLASADGSVTTSGNAQFYGSMVGKALNSPIVGIAATPDGKGYWLVAADGGIFTFGDAKFFGSTGNIHLNKPIVGIASTPSGNGYWLVASDGGIFTFGDAKFFGSTGNLNLSAPIVGIAATPTGNGYWLVAADGGIFTFGDASFKGSGANLGLGDGVVGISPAPSGSGYSIVDSLGDAIAFPQSTGTSNPITTTAGTSSQNTTQAPVATTQSGLTQTWNSYGLTPNNQESASSAYPVEQANPAPASNGYGVLERQSNGLPVRWSGAQPIQYEVNVTQAPPGGLALVQQTFQQLSAATGLTFQYIGTTSELPSLERSPYATNAAGQTIWAPVLVAWESPGQTDYLPNYGGIIGEGGSQAAYNGSQWVYVTGQASLSTAYPFTQEQLVSLIHHELGHVVGMGHVNDPTQVMNPVDNYNAPETYQAGDLAGLAHLGLAEGVLQEPPA